VSDLSGSVYTDVAPITLTAPGCAAAKNTDFGITPDADNDTGSPYSFDYSNGAGGLNAPMRLRITIVVSHLLGYDECPVTCRVIDNTAPSHFKAEFSSVSSSLALLDIYSIND